MITKFKEQLDLYLRENKMKKYEFANKLGVTTHCLYTYRYGLRKVPKHIMLACERVSHGELDFDLED